MRCLFRTCPPKADLMCCHVSSRDRTEQPELSSSGHGIMEHRDHSLLLLCGVRCPHLTLSFPSCILHVFIIIICSANILLADTTWVAGDVYGVWDTTGSPFMATDTITVPLDSTLEIQPGVEIWFLDQGIRRTPFNVHGRLLAIGEEGDSIYFYSPVAGFGGIRNEETPGTEIRMEYCVIDSTFLAITSYLGEMVLLHSRIHGSNTVVVSGYLVRTGNNIDTVKYCDLFALPGRTLNFDFGHGTSDLFQYNYGPYIYFIASSGQIAPIHDNHMAGIAVDLMTYTEIYDNDIGLEPGLTAGDAFACNTYWHDNHMVGILAVTSGEALVEWNTMDGVYTNEARGIFQNNVINGQIRILDCELTFQNNLIVSPNDGFWIMGGIWVNRSSIIRRNTIIFDNEGIDVSPSTQPTFVYDNIFVGDGVNCTGIYSHNAPPFEIRYNDFHQVTQVTYGCELDTGNIFQDPLFRGGYPFDYGLQANSPCIDAGDPTSPLDPDSTRADMGVYYYDQLIDQPPVLISPAVVNVQRGTKLRYTAQATDDNGPLRFGFWGLPRWLYRVYPVMDFVENNAYLSGRVPSNQGNFTFGVWVEDGLAQRDSQVVTVVVSPYTILGGEVIGVLAVEDSPYLVVEDVIVPEGESLTIEPGVEIRFQWHDIEDLRKQIIVRGNLHAVGMPEDSIRFIPEFEDSLMKAWRGIWCLNPIDTTHIKYAYLMNPNSGILVDSGAVAVVENSLFFNSQGGIAVINGGWLRLDSCFFYEAYSSFIYVRGSSATITNSHFELPDTAEFVMPFDIRQNSNVSFHGCTFINGTSARFNQSSYGEFIGNTVINLYSAVGFSNGSSGIAANNIFIHGDGVLVGLGDSVLISNNVFFETEVGVEIYESPLEVYVANNLFLNNRYAIENRFSSQPFANISYNDFFGNDSDLVNCQGDSTNIFLDPMVQDTVDFRLSLGSSCIDAGNPDPFFNDPDSTRNDIGCWGGPWGESYPYPLLFTKITEPHPFDFALHPPYPNPFNSVLVIPFTIPTQSEVNIAIYNILGQRVHQFDFSPVSPGVHRVLWDANAMSSGIYFVKLNSQGKEFIRKSVLMK